MVPLASPDESVFFKHINNLFGDTVFVAQFGVFVGAFTIPLPVVGVFHVDVDGHAKAVHAQAVGALDDPPEEGASRVFQVLFQAGEFVQFGRNGFQFFIHAVHFGHHDFATDVFG